MERPSHASITDALRRRAEHEAQLAADCNAADAAAYAADAMHGAPPSGRQQQAAVESSQGTA